MNPYLISSQGRKMLMKVKKNLNHLYRGTALQLITTLRVIQLKGRMLQVQVWDQQVLAVVIQGTLGSKSGRTLWSLTPSSKQITLTLFNKSWVSRKWQRIPMQSLPFQVPILKATRLALHNHLSWRQASIKSTNQTGTFYYSISSSNRKIQTHPCRQLRYSRQKMIRRSRCCYSKRQKELSSCTRTSTA